MRIALLCHSDSILKQLHRSKVLPTKSLCIHPGKSVWVLYVDATCINYDGNVFDAALAAMVAALKNSKRQRTPDVLFLTLAARLPKAVYHEETGQTLCSRKVTIPLQLTQTPVSSSFGIFDSSVTLTICDP